MKRVCKDCGKEFELTSREIQFYKSKNLSLPKRCKECREKNRDSRNGQGVDTSNEKNKNNEIKDMQKTEIRNTMTGGKSKGSRLYKAIASIVVAIALIVAFIPKLFNQILPQTTPPADIQQSEKNSTVYQFRNEDYLTEHFEKHGSEFPYSTKEEYLEGANRVISSKDVLHKEEAEDGDDVYFLEATGEFVIVSTDGYIRTYFKPEDGIDYYNRQ